MFNWGGSQAMVVTVFHLVEVVVPLKVVHPGFPQVVHPEFPGVVEGLELARFGWAASGFCLIPSQ